jgi:hypothetical protein
LVQRLSDTARPRELQQEEAKATDRSVHFVTLELCEARHSRTRQRASWSRGGAI